MAAWKSILPPLNTWHEHFNAQGSRPARYLAVTFAPLIMNTFHNLDFIFNNSFQFTDRYKGENSYFCAKGRLCKDSLFKNKILETNFVVDVLNRELVEYKERGAGGKSLFFQLSKNSIAPHVSEFPVATYKKAHRHLAGAHVTILKGEGYTLM